MTDNEEITVEIESAAPAPDVEVEIEQPKAEIKETKDGEWVQIDDPKIQKKFNDLYKQTKKSDERNRMYWDIIQKQQARLEEVESRFQQTDEATAERVIKEKLREARDNGDLDAEDKYLQELIEFRTDQKLSKKEKESKVEEEYTAEDLEPDARIAYEYFSQTDSSGNLARPWIRSDHPQHKTMLNWAGIIASQLHAENGTVELEEVLTLLDEKMAQPKRQVNTRAPDPMQGNLTKKPARGTIKLTSQEADIARKLGIKPEDYAKHKGR